jgi:hypothetical protein
MSRQASPWGRKQPNLGKTRSSSVNSVCYPVRRSLQRQPCLTLVTAGALIIGAVLGVVLVVSATDDRSIAGDVDVALLTDTVSRAPQCALPSRRAALSGTHAA